MKGWILILGLLLFQQIITGQNRYIDVSKSFNEAHRLILDLRLHEAEGMLQGIKSSDPKNYRVDFYYGYIDFLRAFISEEAHLIEVFEVKLPERLEAVRSGNEDEPFKRFCEAELFLQSALIHLKQAAYLQSFIKVSRAYRLLEENRILFPDFILNNKSLGVIHALIGSVPSEYRWGLDLLGLTGTVEQGCDELKVVLDAKDESYTAYRQEALVMYAFVLFHLSGERSDAWHIIEELEKPETSSSLAVFVRASFAMKTGRNDLAIRILENRPQGPKYFRFLYLDYLLGVARLRRLDKGASDNLERFVREFGGQNYLKDAYRHLAWHSLLFEDDEAFRFNLSACLHNGRQILDEDESAHLWAESGERPHTLLLRARLLYDGGYYEAAKNEVEKALGESDRSQAFRLEVKYRMARIFQGMSKENEALKYFNQVIAMADQSNSYMIANAYLQSGIIYEHRKAYREATTSYNQCLSFRPDQYVTSLHQKARAGLERVTHR